MTSLTITDVKFVMCNGGESREDCTRGSVCVKVAHISVGVEIDGNARLIAGIDTLSTRPQFNFELTSKRMNTDKFLHGNLK